MSNSILRKIFRNNTVEANKKRYVFKKQGRKLYRAERSPVLPRKNVGNCPYCDIPVYVSEGQLLVYKNGQPTHRYCRKENS